MLVILARGNAKICDIHEWDAGHERPFDGTAEGFSGDAGVGEVAVEETGGTGYLVEGEPAALAGEPVDRLEDLEAQRDQLLEAPADLVHRQVHGLVQARDLGDLNEGRRALGEAPDGVLVEVAARGDAGERHPSLRVVVARERPETLWGAKASRGPHLFVPDEDARGVSAGVEGDVLCQRSPLRRGVSGPDLDPPAQRARIEALERPPGSVAAQVQLPWPFGDNRHFYVGYNTPVRLPHGREQALELLIDGPGEVPAPLGRQHVHEAALYPAFPALGRLEAIDGLVELAPPPVDERGQPLDLGVFGEAPRPDLIPGRARRLVGVHSPHDRPLLPLPLRLRLAELALECLYGRRHERSRFSTKTHMLGGILQHPNRRWM